MLPVSRWSATAAARLTFNRAPAVKLQAMWLSGASSEDPVIEDSGTPAVVASNFGGMELDLFKFMVEKSTPFVASVFHPQVLSVTKTELTLAVPFNKTLVGNPATPCLHGGAVATAMDHAAGFCVWAALNDAHQRVSTVDLRVDYLAPAPCETLHYVAQVQHMSNKLGRVDVVCYDKNFEKKIAIGRACFNIYRTPQDMSVLLKKYMAVLQKQQGPTQP